MIRSLSKGISSRTLQVTVVPTPVKFQERRAVLHALQKFAKVEVFRKLEVCGPVPLSLRSFSVIR